MKISTLVFSFFIICNANAQFTFGEQAAVRLTNYAELNAGGVRFLPSATANLEKNLFQRLTSPEQMRGSVYSIAQVISFSEPIVFKGTLRLAYSEADLNGNLESDLKFSFKVNGLWRSSTLSTVNTSENFVEENLSNQTIQSMTLSPAFFTLPVSLMSFSAALQTNGQVLVQWQTENETNNSHFSIERSSDGIRYTSIGTVQAFAANGRGRYTFIDLQPVIGSNYYRLRQHDMDGAEKLHGVRIVNIGDANRLAIITPNPVTTGFLLDLRRANNKPMAYIISSSGGQTVQQGQVGGQRQWISISGVPSGTYILRLADGQTIRFQKQ
jgi:hypothetical protein